MAHWSQGYIKVQSKNRKNIESFIAEVRQMQGVRTDQETQISTHGAYTTAFISLEGRWQLPQEPFYNGKIFAKYNLDGYIEDSEMGNDFFYQAYYQDGKKIREVDENYFCKESIEAWGVDYWLEHYEEDFLLYGWEETADIRKVFNKAGYPDPILKQWYYYGNKNPTSNITFIVGNNGTGKTTLAEELNDKYLFSIIKTDTTRPPRVSPAAAIKHPDFSYPVTSIAKADAFISAIHWDDYEQDDGTYPSVESTMGIKAAACKHLPLSSKERHLYLDEIGKFAEIMGDNLLKKAIAKEKSITKEAESKIDKIISFLDTLASDLKTSFNHERYVPFGEGEWYNFRDAIDPSEMVEYATFGDHIYATSKQGINVEQRTGTNFVKVIEPQGLAALLEYLKDKPNIHTSVVFMDIDEKVVFENLKQDGFSIEEIDERISRGTIHQDMKRYGITPDVVVAELNEHTAVNVAEQISGAYVARMEEQTKAELNEAVSLLQKAKQEGKIDKDRADYAQLKEVIGKYYTYLDDVRVAGMLCVTQFDVDNSELDVVWGTNLYHDPVAFEKRIEINEMIAVLNKFANKAGIDLQEEKMQEMAEEYLNRQAPEGKTPVLAP